MKKLFGGIDLTWSKIIIAVIIAGGFTAVMAIIPRFTILLSMRLRQRWRDGSYLGSSSL
jgi:hypothetical protein